MSDKFNLYDIYEHNLNFLFGAGASYGFLPTLALQLKDADGESYTFETLAKDLDDSKKESLYSLLFMHYYKKCIYTGLPHSPRPPFPPHRVEVLDEYKRFLQTLLITLDKQSRSGKKCNIYTTNYDSCFEISADNLLSEQAINCVVNDGSAGFQHRRFHTKNFNNRVVQKGIFDKHDEYLPQLNILHPHGSVYWKKEGQGIEVNYGQTSYNIKFDVTQERFLEDFEKIVNDDSKSLGDLIAFYESEDWSDFSSIEFWDKYKQIPIVNPTKWKFHETVFEEAYYQILRHLSFELERPNAALITFGFSFADEHILHLVQRSLSNPTLTVYISCFNEDEQREMKKKFKGYNNVKYICIDEDLTFKRFNNRIFTLTTGGK
ncbi:SIR2 family protein [Psychromonas sp. PT13]|uniref:SIR2 family protein n=1 Tax=Psychromonas sp. PT13 TaxID=3439547 RepID=UPI003EB7A58E